MHRLARTTLLFLLISCGQTLSKSDLQHTIDDYYSTYQQRTDFDKFLTFYDADIILEDMISGTRVIGIEDFKTFFDWNNPNFKLQDSLALRITDQTITSNRIFTSGYFTSFSWNGTTIETMQFYTILHINEEGNIERQIDWINYPTNLIDYSNRKSSNEWIE